MEGCKETYGVSEFLKELDFLESKSCPAQPEHSALWTRFERVSTGKGNDDTYRGKTRSLEPVSKSTVDS